MRMAAEDYRAFAAQCTKLAQNMRHPADKARLIDMAQAWRDLADRLAADSDLPTRNPIDRDYLAGRDQPRVSRARNGGS
jgi:hypothetical protein